jgi:hypothetical protein
MYHPPGLLKGREKVDGISGVGFEYILGNAQRLNALGREVGDHVGISWSLEPRTFARFLAKVAHCYIWAIYGNRYGHIDSFLPPLIDETDLATGYYIGNADMHWRPITKIGPHHLAAEHREGLLLVYIRLFGEVWRTSHLYQIVAGRFRRQASANH